VLGQETEPTNMEKTFYIKTLGCQMNVHDSEKIAGILEGQGYRAAAEQDGADLVVINTCSIREKADQKFFSELGKICRTKAEKPDLQVAVAGCIAQQQGRRIRSRFPQVDLVFGPQNIPRLPDLLRNARGRPVATDENPDFHLETVPTRRREVFRAWVSIMYGCDNFCSYCIVPHTRGRERSRPVVDIISEITGLASNGCIEVTLLGQNVNSYGKGLMDGAAFPELLEKVAQIERLKRIRFVTSHPKDLSPELIGSYQRLAKLCSHIHLPLQSGSDRILERMNRRYTVNQYREKVGWLRAARPDIAITTDIIVGFPGETQADFDRTMALVREVGYDGIFAFKYSKRPHTQAVRFDDHVSEEEKAIRLDEVLSVQEDIGEIRNQALVGSKQSVLVEGHVPNETGWLSGRTSGNKIVHFEAPEDVIGNLVSVQITEGYRFSLKGNLIS